MSDYRQGDVIKIEGLGKCNYVIVSKNAFIRVTGVFHVSPMLRDIPDGPLHIQVTGKNSTEGTVICEQIKLIDPEARRCSIRDSLKYADIMNISDAIQGVFEYD